jgi:lipid-binding SYLF domain-containing protein
VIGVIFLAAAIVPARADDATDAKALVEEARLSLESLMVDPNMGAFRDTIKRARGVLVIPQALRAAFIFGARGGSGVLVTRDEKGKNWRGPAFYTLGGASFGFQAGADAAEVVMLAMTERGVTQMLNPSLKLGGDVSVAAGPVGAGVAGGTAGISSDLIIFSHAKGLYGGFSVDGGVLTPRKDLNEAYYGKAVTPTEILIKGAAIPAGAKPLLGAVTKAASAK